MAFAVKWRDAAPVFSALTAQFTQAYDDMLIIRALILRNLRVQHAKNPFGVMVEYLRPVAICLAHFLFFTIAKRPVPGHEYAVFTIGGFAIYFCFIAAYQGAYDGAKWPMGANQIPGVTRMHLRLARVFWSFILHAVFAVVVVLPVNMLGQHMAFPNIALTLTTFSLAAALGFGYGMVIGNIAMVVPALSPFLKIFQWAVFITSGVYDSLVTMPPLLAQYIWYNPLIHLAEFQRYAYDPDYPIYLVSLTYALCWAAGFVLLGLAMNRALCNRRYL